MSVPVEWLPYDPRPGQRAIVETVEATIRRAGHAVVEAPTGSGKTVAVLAPALRRARATGRTVLYLTRTHAQQAQVVEETRAIRDHVGADLQVAPLQGRRHLCPLVEEDATMARAGPSELSMLCRDRQEATARAHPRSADDGCSYYRGWLDGADGLRGWIAREAPTAESVLGRARERSVCPYEAVRDAASEADVAVAPYIYLLHPGLRRAVLGWLERSPSELIVVVDEAHNLPGQARELASDKLSATSLERARGEVETFEDPEVLDGIRAGELLRLVELEVEELANEHVEDGDALLPPDRLREALMTRFQVPDVRLREAFERLVAQGEAIRQARRRDGDLPRSHVGRAGTFLTRWFRRRAEPCARVVSDDPALRLAALDPTARTDVLGDVHASLHVSGTIAGLEAYRDAIGLPPSASARRVSWSELSDRMRVGYVPGLTTRHADLRDDDRLLGRLHATVDAILDAAPVSAMVAFPSFQLLARFRDRGLDADVVEDPHRSQAKLQADLAAFRRAEAGRMLVVSGGRLCEGVDLPGDELMLVVQVGIPYPAPTAVQTARKRWLDARTGDGFRRAVHLPAARRLRQTVGRLIRSPGDRGVAVILDERATRFRDPLPELDRWPDPADAVRKRLGVALSGERT